MIPELVKSGDATQSVRFYAVFDDNFGDRRAPFFIHWFTRPRFRHVYLLLPAKIGTLIVNPLAGGIRVDWAPFDPAACALACVEAGLVVAEGDTKINLCYKWRGLITCVSVVKALIGLNDWRIITPYQLYRRLANEQPIQPMPS